MRAGRVRMDSFYKYEELATLGLKTVGKDVLISRKASFYRPEMITIGDHTRIDDFAFISGAVTLGAYVHVAPFCALVGGEDDSAGIVLDDYSGLSGNVMIYAVSDDYSGEYMTNPTVPQALTNVTRARVTLGRFAIVGASSVLLPGAALGEGTAVGAMSLVTHSLPGWKICAGKPARPLRDRSRELLDKAGQLGALVNT